VALEQQRFLLQNESKFLPAESGLETEVKVRS
jgi:hypothetical protein